MWSFFSVCGLLLGHQRSAHRRPGRDRQPTKCAVASVGYLRGSQLAHRRDVATRTTVTADAYTIEKAEVNTKYFMMRQGIARRFGLLAAGLTRANALLPHSHSHSG